MVDYKPSDILRHSVLDRVIRNDPRRGIDLRIGVDELKTIVRRDIEWLLNTRQSVPEYADKYSEIPSSVYAYGIPDFTQFSGASTVDKDTVRKAVENALKLFEPRLLRQSIRVSFVESEGLIGSKLFLKIQGILHVEPIHEPVSFATSIELDSGAVQLTTADV